MIMYLHNYCKCSNNYIGEKKKEQQLIITWKKNDQLSILVYEKRVANVKVERERERVVGPGLVQKIKRERKRSYLCS